ncbi:MAG: NAD(P)H-dependent oxidoreductase subunit E [Acidobacteriota bacterium]
MFSMEKVDSIIERYKGEKSSLIAMLQDLQAEFNYLPKDALKKISENTNIPISRIYSVVTFFKAFSLKPKGKHIIKVCLGTACQIKQGAKILENFEKELNIKEGETTKDMKFSLHKVYCLGCCGQAPASIIGEDVYGYLTPYKIKKIITKFK